MKTVGIKSVFEAIIRLRGYDPATANLSAVQKAVVAELLNERVIEAWEAAFWPEIMLVEEREYRPTWDAELNYNTDDEIYYEDTYYISLQNSNVGKQPDTETDWWSEVGAGFIRTISYTQDNENEIGAVDIQQAIYDRDPRIYPSTKPLEDVVLYEDAILVKTDSAPLKPWVKFRPPAPEFSWTDWNFETNYAIGELCYYASSGESYKALLPSTNKNPYQETTYWEPINFPQFLKTFVKHAVNADQTEEDEGRFKEEAKAQRELSMLHERLIDQQGNVRKVVFRRG